MAPVIRFRMWRQCLAPGARRRGRDGLVDVMERIGPVGLDFSPAAYVEGFRPAWWDELVENGRVVKARLIGGRVSYLAPRHAWLCLAAYGRGGHGVLTDVLGQRTLDLVRARGPVSKEELGRTLGIRGRTAYGVLTRLARQLILVEFHRAGRGKFKGVHLSLWDIPERAWEGLPRFRGDRQAALRELSRVFLRSYGPSTDAEILGWAGMGDEGLLEAIREMCRAGEVVPTRVGVSRARFYALRDELPQVESAPELRPFVVLLGAGDPLVRACRQDLVRDFGKGNSVRHWFSYVLVDGEFRGAVDQQWRERVCWVSNLALDETVAGDPARVRELLAQLEARAADAGQDEVVVAAINGRDAIRAPERAVLDEMGYVPRGFVLVRAGIGEARENGKLRPARLAPGNGGAGNN